MHFIGFWALVILLWGCVSWHRRWRAYVARREVKRREQWRKDALLFAVKR